MATITGGGFQDALSNPLANGTLKWKLSSDSYTSNGALLVCAGEEFEVALSSEGNIIGTIGVIGNDVLTGVWSQKNDTYYLVRAEAEDGQLAWGPNAIIVTGATFNLSNVAPSVPA